MKITVFYDRKNFFGNMHIWTDEEEVIHSESELKKYLRILFSAMKKDVYQRTTFRIEADAGFYMVVDRYDGQAESFRTVYHGSWNSEDVPVMFSQRNLTSWALDVWKTEEQDRESAA
jgi:hypothetical protein